MTRPTTTGKAQDLITFTRSTTGTALAKISYGEELVTNGDFASGSTGWALSNWTWSNGSLSITNLTGSITQAVTPLVTGKTYTVSLEVSELTQGNWYLWVNGTYVIGASTETGAIKYSWTQSSADKNVKVVCGVSSTLTVDNISIKEVLYDQPDGTLQLFNHPIDKPRIEYDASGNCLGLLVEEARTNSQGNSENIDAAWSQKAAGRTEVLSNQITAPDGTSSADLIQAIDGSSSGEQYSRRFISSISSTNTLSVFVKKKNWRYIAIRLIGNRVFDFDTEAFTSGSGTIQKLPNGWYRLSVTDAAGGPAYIGVGTASNASVIPWPTAPQNNEGVYVWGAQLEASFFPTSYIPTSGSAVTRAADVASLAVSEFGYNQDQGSVVVEASVNTLEQTNHNDLSLYGNGNTRIDSGYRVGGPSSGVYTLWVRNNNVDSALLLLSGITANTPYKTAYSLSNNDFALSLNGGSVAADTSGPVPTINQVKIGFGYDYLNGHIKSIQYYPLRLSNAQLQALTV